MAYLIEYSDYLFYLDIIGSDIVHCFPTKARALIFASANNIEVL